ncbi:M23 family metallopeptidase [Mangrovicella endophytica]|uniref:M23 family metallopeptidase n=1 Tax=Mangrovicella endophytica TaxID=2066697 RepID=UPI000C9E7936|nr:M23 family metallopeptidase [Mangrovicella endophytica]
MGPSQHDRTFGKRTVPHTVIIARGEKVRHFTVSTFALIAASAMLTLGVGGGIVAAIGTFSGSTVVVGSAPTEVRLAYEQRIASLRSQLDRLTSRQLIDQQLVETKVDVLLDQQEELSARYDKLRPLLDRVRSAGLLPAAVPVPQQKPEDAGSTMRSGGADTGVEALGFAPAADRSALRRFDLVDPGHGTRPTELNPNSSATSGNTPAKRVSESMIRDIGRSIDVAELQQIVHLNALAEHARSSADEITTTLRSAGIRLSSVDSDSGTGGPYEPVPQGYDFEASYAMLDQALDQLQSVKATAQSLPLQAPLKTEVVSSSFGVRSDPFLGRSAFHAGIDFVAGNGTSATATAAGTVISAGRSGGYGNMVEIDHGNGFTTRYGHLSGIAVTVGETVKAGDTIGYTGSTGRSTGPHLHYEVRRNGEAIDPASFLKAGHKISALG